VASVSLDRYFREQRGTHGTSDTHGMRATRGGQRKARGRTRRNETELQAAREQFERHFGAVDLGYATGLDNEEIDADLEREYASIHEKA
jgi:hypothetical protein